MNCAQVPKPVTSAVPGLLNRTIEPSFLNQPHNLPKGSRTAECGSAVPPGKGQPVVPPPKQAPVVSPPMMNRLLKSSNPCPPSPSGRKRIRMTPCEALCSSAKYRKCRLGSYHIGRPVIDPPLILKGHVLVLFAFGRAESM